MVITFITKFLYIRYKVFCISYKEIFFNFTVDHVNKSKEPRVVADTCRCSSWCLIPDLASATV